MYELPNLGTNIFTNKPVKQDYSGPQDEKSGMSDGIGSIIYNRDDYMQSYEGKLIWNNMHGYGEYRWEPPKCKYEGQLYGNKREGYGRFSYPSGACFEGLYLNDQRFGPGVYTDAAGYQDVGVWIASKLIRLSRVFVPEGLMPRLASTNVDKIRILRYRKIIRLNEEKAKDLAENLLESLTHLRNYDKTVVDRAEELYNRLCRDDRAPSFNKPRYDEAFFGNVDDQLTIDVLMTEEEIEQKIAAEKEEHIEIGDSHSDMLEIKKSHIISEIYNSNDNRYNDKISRQDKSEENVSVDKNTREDQEEEEEADYCGIKNIDLMDMENKIFAINHEEQWNIFQSSAVTVPQDAKQPENSSVNSSNEDDLKDSVETKTSEEKFDDFGRKKVKDVKPTKKVVVTHLMAWNNSPILIELLKHVFKHRNFEKKLSFDISKVLAGRRGSFRQEGAHEKAALELFQACSSGFENKILKLISRHDLYVDVADSRGNTGLFLAAARDRLGVMDTLFNLGANVDSINDECLTPLSMCVLRVLEVVHCVTNWAEAFLPKNTCGELIADDEFIGFKNLEQWHGRVSYESLVQQLPKQMDRNPSQIGNDLQFDSKDFRNGAQTQKYIFDTSPITGTFDLRKKLRNDKTKNKNNKIKDKSTTVKNQKDGRLMNSKELLRGSKQTEDIVNGQVSKQLVSVQISDRVTQKEKICATISKLLQRGADPNLAQVPYPVLIMAIFTKVPSLVSELLEHGANPDTTLDKADHHFTPLLILAVLKPAYEHSLMAKALLMAEADPNARADPEYRRDLMERFKLKRSPKFLNDSEGMTALHLLAIRPDIDTDSNEYLGELIKVIYQHGCISGTDLYQGHSPLSLAIFGGNLTAAKAFLKTCCVNVNEQLGTDLGNAMLMLESCVLQELLPPDLLREFLELLLEYGGCPFASAIVLDEEYNQIEYGRKELIKMTSPTENNVEELKEKKKKNKSKGSKSPRVIDAINFAKSMEFVEKKAKEKLIERIKANFVKDLMDSLIKLLSTQKQSELLKNPIFTNAMTWMTGEDVAVVMKTMNYNRSYVRELVRLFVTACILRQEETSPEVDTLIRNETERIINEAMPLVDQNKQIARAADFGVERKASNRGTKKLFDQISLCRTESNLDDNRFKVCFECLAVREKILISCPKCKRVYFCSQYCNIKSSAQEENLHQCPVFYQKELTRLEIIDRGINPLSYTLERFSNPELYNEDEKNTKLYNERRDKRSVQNQDDETFVSTPKCKDQDYTTKKYGGEQTGDKSEDPNEYEDEVKRGNDSDMRSKKRHKNDSTSDREDKKVAAISKKKNKKERDNFVRDDADLGNGIKSKTTNKKITDSSNNKSRRLDVENNEKDAFNKIKSKKEIKNRYGKTINEVEGNFGNKMKLKKGKREDEFEQNREDGIKVKKGNKKVGEFNNKYDYNDLKFKSIKGNRSKGKKGGEVSNDFHKANNDNEKDGLHRKREPKRNKKEWKYGLNEKLRRGDSQAPNESDKNSKSYEKTNVPEKYLDWILKVSRSAGEHLDVDMLFLPYVVFAQGDTYFRILPANQFPKFTGNYSLI